MSSLDEGMMTAADVVTLLEDHGVEVDDAREVATTVDGERVRATLSVTAPVDLELGDTGAGEVETDGPATDEDIAESVDGVQTDAEDEFLDRVDEAVDLDDGNDKDDPEADADGREDREDDVLPEFEDLVDERDEGADDADDPDPEESEAPDVYFEDHDEDDGYLSPAPDKADPEDVEEAIDEEEVDAGEDADPAPETEGSDDERDAEDAPDEFGVATAKSYGITLNGTVADHFKTDRVTVIGRPHGADLIPGTDAEGPDYAVGRSKIQLGDPGRFEIGVDVDEEIRAIPDGDAVRLEPVDGAGEEDPAPDDAADDEPAVKSTAKTDEDEADEQQDEEDGLWCGVCGEGGFTTAGEVEDHHDDVGHAGDPIASATDPAEGELVSQMEADSEDFEFWCGHCGAGPESSQTEVRNHHDREDHPGEPVVLSDRPSDADLIENGGPDRSEPDTDRVLRERVVEYLLDHARDGDRFFKPEDIAFALDESGNDVVDVLNELVSEELGRLDVRPVGVSGQMWRAERTRPTGLTEADVHSVAEVSDNLQETAENFEVPVEYARVVLEAHECLDDVVDEDQEVAPADD